MGFLDNSGDIILDAVLTDLGRKKLAQGNFNITQFALGDEEIDYSLYDINHASGSAYYDLEILQTPVLEAFTNNTSTMKSSLVTYSNTDLLFLPVLDLNQGNAAASAILNPTTKTMLLTANSTTETTSELRDRNSAESTGVLLGASTQLSDNRFIRIDQLIPNSGATEDTRLSTDLVESEYFIHVDYRLLRIADTNGNQVSTAAVDDDNRAIYSVSGDSFLNTININSDTKISDSDLRGEVGTRLQFKLMVSNDVKNSNTLFTRVGRSNVAHGDLGLTLSSTANYRIIDTIITIEGTKNGTTIDLPIRIIKVQ